MLGLNVVDADIAVELDATGPVTGFHCNISIPTDKGHNIFDQLKATGTGDSPILAEYAALLEVKRQMEDKVKGWAAAENHRRSRQTGRKREGESLVKAEGAKRTQHSGVHTLSDMLAPESAESGIMIELTQKQVDEVLSRFSPEHEEDC